MVVFRNVLSVVLTTTLLFSKVSGYNRPGNKNYDDDDRGRRLSKIGDFRRILTEIRGEVFGTSDQNAFDYVRSETINDKATEDQVRIPYYVGDTVRDCKNRCHGSRKLEESEAEQRRSLTVILDVELCKIGCDCVEACHDKSRDSLCRQECRSSYNGYEVYDFHYQASINLLECEYGENIDNADCHRVQSDWNDYRCHGSSCQCKATRDCPVGPFCSNEYSNRGCTSDGGAMDDPHFKTWAGTWYDYMGQCDLHLLHAPHFAPGQNLTVDIRTTIRNDYSYIESAAVMIGEEKLEVSGFGQYMLNGVANADLPATLSDFHVTHEQPTDKLHLFEIKVAGEEAIHLKTFKDMVSVKVVNAENQRFHDSVGMMGDFATGELLARDGVTVMNDPNMLAKEWQVRLDEPMLFASPRAPQYPQECILPDPSTKTARRLGETVALAAAELACNNAKAENKDACVHDVMATGDLDLAAAGAF